MEYDHPLRLFMVSLRLRRHRARDLARGPAVAAARFLRLAFRRGPRARRGLGGLLVAYGFLLCGVAFTLR